MKKKSKAIKKSSHSIKNSASIFTRRYGDTELTVARRVLRKLQELSQQAQKRSITELASSQLLPKLLTPLYARDKPYEIISLGGWLNPEHHIYWLLGLFRRHHLKLKKFNQLRNNFNELLLQGNAAAATKCIDDIDEISFSWWSIENRVNIQKELLGLDTKDWIHSLYERLPGEGTSSKIIDLLVLSESTSIQFFVDSIKNKLKEYRGSDIKSAVSLGACLSCLSLPISEDPERNVDLEDLFAYKSESLIDQYVLLKSAIIDMHSKDTPLNPGLEAVIFETATLLNDSELLNVLQDNGSTSEFVLEIVNDYTLGQYSDVVAKIQKELCSNPGRIIGLVEIYARSLIYTKEENTDKSLYSRLATELKAILLVESDSKIRIEYIKKICIKFCNEQWARSLMFHILSIADEHGNYDTLELARLQTKCLGELNTPKAQNKDFVLLRGSSVQASEVPAQRLIRYESRPNLETLARTTFPIFSDFIKLQTRIYLENGKTLDAVKFAISEYFSNRMTVIHLPLKKLCDAVLAIDDKHNESWILALIILDIYGREINEAYDETKSELLEELLLFNGTHRPSELYISKEINQVDAYFLRYICLPSQLDNLIEYNSHDEVIHERVAILDRLIALDPDDDLRSEKDRVVETIFTDKLRAKIESGKLFVDVQALEAHRKHVYLALYEEAKSINDAGASSSGSGELNPEALDYFQLSSGAVASDKRTGILHKIFIQAVNDFALNENYGLDKYLSAEVRHTVFVTQLRSCFEKTHLVTVQQDGEYLSNDYWCSSYHYVHFSVVNEIDDALKRFSEKIDLTLKAVNNRFRVAVSTKHEDYIFDFKSYSERLIAISDILNKSDNFESFFRFLIDFLWQIAGHSAKEAQNLINGSLKSQIELAVTELECEINKAKGEVAMLDLMQEIKNAKSNFNKEIELVLNWFRFVGANDLDSVEKLGVVIEASVASFDSIYGHKGNSLIFTQAKSDLLLNYRESRALFISLFTVLENSFKYGTEEGSTTISHRRASDEDYITVRNYYKPENLGNIDEFLHQQKIKWADKNSKLSREEGGSGLYKVNNLLLNSSKGFSFDLEIAEQFNAIVRLKNEYFNNRR